jgi:hypothetical protein
MAALPLLDQVGQDHWPGGLEGEQLVGSEGVELGGVVPVAVPAQDGLGPLLEARTSGVKVRWPGTIKNVPSARAIRSHGR